MKLFKEPSLILRPIHELLIAEKSIREELSPFINPLKSIHICTFKYCDF